MELPVLKLHPKNCFWYLLYDPDLASHQFMKNSLFIPVDRPTCRLAGCCSRWKSMKRNLPSPSFFAFGNPICLRLPASPFSSLPSRLENVFAIREKFDIAGCSSSSPVLLPPVGIGACKTEARPTDQRAGSRRRSLFLLLSGPDGGMTVAVVGRRIECCSVSLSLSRRQSDRTSEHDMPRGTGGKGRRQRHGGARGRRAKSGLIYFALPSSLLLWPPRPTPPWPRPDRPASDDDVRTCLDSTQVPPPLFLPSFARQEFHLAAELIQYSVAHNEAAR